MRVLLLLLLALNVALTLGAGDDHHRSKRGIMDYFTIDYLTGLIYKGADIVFRSFSEASGYKVTKLPLKATEKSYTSDHQSGKKSSEKTYTNEKKTHFATTTERVVTHGESYYTKSGPHKTDFNFHSEDAHSDYDKWASKKPQHEEEEHHHHHHEHEEEDNNDHHHNSADHDDFKVWVASGPSGHEEESKVVKKKRPTRIKLQRKGEEEKVHINKFSREGPNLGLSGFSSKSSNVGSGEESRVKKPMIIRVLTPTPSKMPPIRMPEGSLEDSWPSVWRGAH